MHTAAAAAGVPTVGDGMSDWEKTDGNCRAAARRGCSATQLKKINMKAHNRPCTDDDLSLFHSNKFQV